MRPSPALLFVLVTSRGCRSYCGSVSGEVRLAPLALGPWSHHTPRSTLARYSSCCCPCCCCYCPSSCCCNRAAEGVDVDVDRTQWRHRLPRRSLPFRTHTRTRTHSGSGSGSGSDSLSFPAPCQACQACRGGVVEGGRCAFAIRCRHIYTPTCCRLFALLVLGLGTAHHLKAAVRQAPTAHHAKAYTVQVTSGAGR